MLTIAIATVLAIIIAVIMKKNHEEVDSIIQMVENIICIGIVIGVFFPISGYSESVFLKQIDIVGLRQFGEEYTYTYEVNRLITAEGDGVEYTSNTIKGENVKVIEDSRCESPVLRIYTKKPNKSIWTFALFGIDKEYVFYIPKKVNRT